MREHPKSELEYLKDFPLKPNKWLSFAPPRPFTEQGWKSRTIFLPTCNYCNAEPFCLGRKNMLTYHQPDRPRGHLANHPHSWIFKMLRKLVYHAKWLGLYLRLKTNSSTTLPGIVFSALPVGIELDWVTSKKSKSLHNIEWRTDKTKNLDFKCRNYFHHSWTKIM